MKKEEYLEFLNDMENNLKTIEGSKKNWNAQEILAILSLKLEIAKEKYRIKEWFYHTEKPDGELTIPVTIDDKPQTNGKLKRSNYV